MRQEELRFPYRAAFEQVARHAAELAGGGG